MVFDGKYVLIADYYGNYPTSQEDNQRITAEDSGGYLESASAREVVHEADIKTLADKSGNSCAADNQEINRVHVSPKSADVKTSAELNWDDRLTKERLK